MIDTLLELYHAERAKKNTSSIGPQGLEIVRETPSVRKDWMYYMNEILRQCFDHLLDKTSSDRRGAVLRLARTVAAALSGYMDWKDKQATQAVLENRGLAESWEELSTRR
jgi:hypothetical protein